MPCLADVAPKSAWNHKVRASVIVGHSSGGIRLRLPLLVSLSLALVSAGCDRAAPDVSPTHADERATRRKVKRACGSAQAFDRLKALAFEQAARARGAGSPALVRLAAESVIRMEEPAAKSHDLALDIVTCTGHLVLELPPGAETAFGGARRLEADVEYTAQEAADGSGLIYQLRGAEPIVRRLAGVARQPGIEPVAARMPPARSATPAPRGTAAGPVPGPSLTPPRPGPSRPAARGTGAVVQDDEALNSRPSFDCDYARSRVERLICTNTHLAANDRAMSSIFNDALMTADRRTRSALQASRDRFLAFRDRCSDEACVAQAYQDRIDEIRDIAEGRY